MRVAQGQTFEAVAEFATTGLLASARLRIDDNQGNTILAAQAFDRELGTTGVYAADLGGIATLGQYTILASSDGSFDPETVASEELEIVADVDEAPSVPPLVPISEDGAGQQGPCQAWTSAEAMEAAGCCAIEGSDPSVLDDSIVAASQLLYPLSNAKYPGTCESTVRPCGDELCPGHMTPVRWDGAWYNLSSGSRSHRACGCVAVSQVALAGHARSVLEVTIDGEVVDPDTYELREHLWLVRLGSERWPSCQNMREALGEEGTFGVTYEFGFDPPSSGIQAAQELACAIYESCTSSDPADCVLPQGITRIERQGITYDLEKFRGWGLVEGIWRTGLPLVDAFLNAENPKGGRGGRAQVWSPDLWRYPRPAVVSGS